MAVYGQPTNDKPELTAVEWVEIALAVGDKLERVQSGLYDDEPGDEECKAWAEHLQEILDELGPKVANGAVPKGFKPELSREDWQEIYYALDDGGALQQKIGPDGSKMY